MSKPPKKTRRLCVEQAVAFGRSHKWMREHLGADAGEIAAAVQWIEDCNDEDEHGRPPIPCGTHAAYNRHKSNGEPPCCRCRYGEAEFQAERRIRNGHRPRTARHMIGGRPVESYYGPADSSTLTDLIDALSPTYSRVKKQRDAA